MHEELGNMIFGDSRVHARVGEDPAEAQDALRPWSLVILQATPASVSQLRSHTL